jgi:hypothetical protein
MSSRSDRGGRWRALFAGSSGAPPVPASPRRWVASLTLPAPAPAVACAALLAGWVLAGCGLGAGPTPSGVRLDVTRDFGAQTLRSLSHPHAAGQETVMSLLLRNAKVGTRYGGGFVQSVDGLSGSEGAQVAWFYYVNGVLAPKGAAETNIHPGDRIWWDLHDWSRAEEIPAVVGSFPEPFRDGIEGLRLPVRVECAEPQGALCHTVTTHLRAVGVTSGLAALGPAGEEPDTLRLLVGTWLQVRGDPGAQALERGPAASGVYARPAADGRSIALLDARGATARTLTGSAGLIAATRYTGEDPEWLITGTDAAGVQLAANDLGEAALHDRFAVAITETGLLPVPQPTGG